MQALKKTGLILCLRVNFEIGEAGVGKTSITKRFVTESFTSAYMHTIGIDFDEKVVEIGEKRVRLQVGRPRGTSLTLRKTCDLRREDKIV